MAQTVVYTVAPEGVSDVLKVLRRHGLHPAALDEPTATVYYASRWTYRVRIAVPAEEAE